jgi:hypothetical protein
LGRRWFQRRVEHRRAILCARRAFTHTHTDAHVYTHCITDAYAKCNCISDSNANAYADANAVVHCC